VSKITLRDVNELCEIFEGVCLGNISSDIYGFCMADFFDNMFTVGGSVKSVSVCYCCCHCLQY